MTTKEELTNHPLEKVFDVQEGSTMVEYEEKLPTVSVQHVDYDNKDKEIEDQFQEIYDSAMDAYEIQMGNGDDLDAKFKGRNAEVASMFLNTALNAAKEKADLKKHKDKISDNEEAKSITNNNLVLDHSALLKILKGKD